MDSRLIPPSHFDPTARDSLENSPAPSPVSGFSCGQPILTHGKEVSTSSQSPVTNLFLKPPDDFSSATVKISSRNDGFLESRLSARQPEHDAWERAHLSMPGNQAFQPQLSVNPNPRIIPRNLPFRFSGISEHESNDLLRLQNENEALRNMIQYRKLQIDAKNSGKSDGCTMHEAVIEHQTQHIRSLQKEGEEKTLQLCKSENEIASCKEIIARHEEANNQLTSSLEEMQQRLALKDETENNLRVNLANIQESIHALEKEKNTMSENHSMTIAEIKQTVLTEKEEVTEQLLLRIKETEGRLEKQKISWKAILDNEKLESMKELSALTDSHEKEKQTLQSQWDEKMTGCRQENAKLMKDLEDHRIQIHNLSESLKLEKSEREDLKSTIESLRHELSESEQTANSYLGQVGQLQAYIGEQQAEDYERSRWKKEKANLEERILSLQGDKEGLNKTLELQNVRFQSISKILSTQEEAVQANAKALSVGNIRGNPERVLVRRWREKVFELMVQCKASEISNDHNENKWKLARDELMTELEEEKRVAIILESQLCESRAQLEMYERENSALSVENKRLSEELQSATEKSSKFEESVLSISEMVAIVSGQLSQQFQNKFTSITEKNVRLEQRITFANNRLRTIQDLLARRDNLWKARLKKVQEERKKKVQENAVEETSTSETERPDLNSEIAQLTAERDHLSQCLLRDSNKLESTATQFRQREEELERNLTQAHHEIQEKSEVIAELRKEIAMYGEKVADCERLASDAREEVRNLTENHNKEIQQQLSEAEEKWEKLNRELEIQLNEARREHARTVVSLRQCERTSVRERKRVKENLDAVTKDHESACEKLRNKIKILQQDNNLLMTTLRQQGLLATFKEARSQVIKLKSETDPLKSALGTATSCQSRSLNGRGASGQKVRFAEDHTIPDTQISIVNSPDAEITEFTVPDAENQMSIERGQMEKIADEDHPQNPIQHERKSETLLSHDQGSEEGSVKDMLKDLVVLTEEILADSDEDF